ncbi:hypothetical protein EDB87DRAFT_1835939, partial [Lactarius vividus]
MHSPKQTRARRLSCPRLQAATTTPPSSAEWPAYSTQCSHLSLMYSFPRQVTIGKLSNEVLLNIFRHYLDASPQFWPRLVHICRKWRHIVFASQQALHLRLFCTHGTPVLKNLDCWPALPIVVQYGGSPTLDSPAPEDDDNVVAALEQSGRVSSISLTITSSLLEKLSAIERPFSELEDLSLLSRDSARRALPSAFQWGSRLRTLHLTSAAIPTLPELISHSTGLVDLQLHKIPDAGYFSPNAFVSALSDMSQLQTLSLHFHSFTHRRNNLGFPPQSGERVVLPVLTCLKYRGSSMYLDNFVARIDAPRLGDIDITFLSQPMMRTSELCLFIHRIAMQKSHRRAEILSSERAISISFTQPQAPTRLKLQVPCEVLACQLSDMARICKGLSAFLLGVEHLRIGTTQPSSGWDHNRTGWLDLIRQLIGAKWVHISGDHSTNVVYALSLRMREEIVLPVLHKICIREPEPHCVPLQEAVVSLIHSRSLAGRIIAVEYERVWISELHGT